MHPWVRLLGLCTNKILKTPTADGRSTYARGRGQLGPSPFVCGEQVGRGRAALWRESRAGWRRFSSQSRAGRACLAERDRAICAEPDGMNDPWSIGWETLRWMMPGRSATNFWHRDRQNSPRCACVAERDQQPRLWQWQSYADAPAGTSRTDSKMSCLACNVPGGWRFWACQNGMRVCGIMRCIRGFACRRIESFGSVVKSSIAFVECLARIPPVIRGVVAQPGRPRGQCCRKRAGTFSQTARGAPAIERNEA